MIYLIVIFVIAGVWSVWGYFSSRVEQAEYSVLKKCRGYEVRKYPAHIVAETTVVGEYREALNQGFRIIAGYIFGDNASRTSVAMTAPVTEARSESIAMTAPVASELMSGSRKISFVMPKRYTLATLPKPNDARVKLVSVPAENMAALRFSWSRSAARVEAKKAELLRRLALDKVEVAGAPSYAGYNAPWTPPWMTRHEILVPIKG